HGLPPIHMGCHAGAFIAWLIRMHNVQQAIEIGTLAGYSAIWIARAMVSPGKLYTLEINPKHAEVARHNLKEAGLEERVEVVVGDALESLKMLEASAPFDCVFIDADKSRYDRYAEWAVSHLRPGGLLIADNAFYFGRLLEESEEAKAMRRFHEIASRFFDAVLVPTPDGLVIGSKRA
ncbi:MAG: O-methyltransferase, partial [Deltaproteobacteria bacterium]|nr:O-methyltransferase [Deltaproteobacteria bacterium]